jgi:hypothetical protein
MFDNNMGNKEDLITTPLNKQQALASLLKIIGKSQDNTLNQSLGGVVEWLEKDATMGNHI